LGFVANRSLPADSIFGELMRKASGFIAVTVLSALAFLGMPSYLSSQQANTDQMLASTAALPDAPPPQGATLGGSSQQDQAQHDQAEQNPPEDAPEKKTPLPQPKRILGVMPNYRAVSAGVLPPPPTPHEAFMVATRNSFDYSSFVFVGITSLLAEGTDAHPQLGKGVGGFWAYSWRGYLDKTDGNYWVDFLMPTAFHQDERYFAKGEGGVWKRSVYASTRVLITPNFHGKNGFNTSEILGRGISQAISLSYYPSQTQTASGFAQKYAYALGRDAITNVFRELWPDINAHVLHRRSQ
jgi:hypothetical protein